MLAAELGVAAALLIAPSGAAPEAVGTTVAAQPTIVPAGDGRAVALTGLGGPRTEPVLRRAAVLMPAAVASVERFWGQDWSRGIPVLATATDAQFTAQAGPAVARPGDVAAVAVADRVDPARHLAAGQRIVLAPGADRMSTESLRIVLTHELFHFAARSATAVDAPRWLTEAVADYVARTGEPVPAVRPFPTALPSDAEFAATGPELSAAYDRAWLFARFVAESYGAPALHRLYLRACGSGHTDVATAVREALGAEPARIVEGWGRWLTG